MEKIKSLADLKKKREELQSKIELREEGDNVENLVQIKVAMATCGIAAGARPVMLAFVDEIQKRQLQHVTVSQTGCVGMCRLEPMVDVYVPGQEKVTYVHVKPEMVPRIVAEHVVNGRPVAEYTIGAAE